MPTPRPRVVALGSLALFATLFVLLTFQLSAGASPAQTKQVNGHGSRAVTQKPPPEPVQSDSETLEAEPEESEFVEPEEEFEEEEAEFEEPEFEEPEVEFVEPEVEEAPPVVTSSS